MVKMKYLANILIDGGTKECGEEYASIINIIDERKEKIESACVDSCRL